MAEKLAYEELDQRVKKPSQFIDKVKRLRLSHLLWMSIIASEIFSMVIVAIMSIIFRGNHFIKDHE